MLETIKESVRQVAIRAQHDGLCKHKAGNFSVHDPETGYVVVTPSGIDRDFLKVEDMVVMDMDGNVIENPTGTKPSSEVLVHIAIYRKRPEVRAVVHTHAPYSTVFAVMNKSIPPFVYEAMYLGNKDNIVPVAPYGRPGTIALAENVSETMRENNACLMQAHGAIACDEKSIENAYLTACYTEELAELYHHILSCNGWKEPELLPAEELQGWAYPKEIKFPEQ